MLAWTGVLGVVIVVVGSVLSLIWGLQSDDKSEQTDYSELDTAQRDHSEPDRQEHDRSSENDSINDDSWPYTGPSPSFDSSSSFGGGISTGSGATGSW